MKDRIITQLHNDDFLERSIQSLSEIVGMSHGESYKEFIKFMNRLEDAGEVVRDKENKYYLPSQLGYVVGTLSMNKKGFGFVLVEDQEKDIYIGSSSLKDAYDQDQVLVEVDKNSGERPEGEILKVIKRGKTKVVGELKQGKVDFYVESSILGLDKRIFIDKAHTHGAMPGHIVVAQIKVYKPTVKGDIVEIVGHKSDPGVDILAIVKEHDVEIEFSKDVYQQIESIQDEVQVEELQGRVDLRDELIVTIDGDDAKDLDDAISLHRLDNGHYRLGVHIADVSHYVTKDSPLDKEALQRGTSIYLVDRVIPMLPHRLSNGICSLNPQVDRLTISCFMEIDQSGKVVDHEIVPSVIHSKQRMTYNKVNKLLAGDEQLLEQYANEKDLFFLMEEVAHLLRKVRDRKGAIDFDTNEAKILVDDRCHPIDVVLRTRGTSDKLIEEFMLLANVTVAKHFKWLDVPFIYRVHEHPKVQKLQQFTKVAGILGYSIPGSLEDVHPRVLSELLESSQGTVEHSIISTLLLRCMQKAEYSGECLGHYGLADTYYTHFTSPIRRYPDLLVHRLIRTYLFEHRIDEELLIRYQKMVQEIAESTSASERKAILVERDVEDSKKAQYMEQFINQEFEGVISSVTNFGFFVELPNTIEGLVHVTSLVDDYYFFDELNMQYIGRHTQKKYRMSDIIKVKVASTDRKEGSIDFHVSGMKTRHHRSSNTNTSKEKKQSYSRKPKGSSRNKKTRKPMQRKRGK